jgi:hypothetical protein
VLMSEYETKMMEACYGVLVKLGVDHEIICKCHICNRTVENLSEFLSHLLEKHRNRDKWSYQIFSSQIHPYCQVSLSVKTLRCSLIEGKSDMEIEACHAPAREVLYDVEELESLETSFILLANQLNTESYNHVLAMDGIKKSIELFHRYNLFIKHRLLVNR